MLTTDIVELLALSNSKSWPIKSKSNYHILTIMFIKFILIIIKVFISYYYINLDLNFFISKILLTVNI